MRRLTRAVELYLEDELENYHENLKKLKLLHEEEYDSSPSPSDGMPHGTTISNPTESKAIRLMTSRTILCIERRLRAVEVVLLRYADNESMTKLIRLRYFKRTHTPFGIMGELHIGQKTYYRWRRELLEDLAAELGL